MFLKNEEGKYSLGSNLVILVIVIAIGGVMWFFGINDVNVNVSLDENNGEEQAVETSSANLIWAQGEVFISEDGEAWKEAVSDYLIKPGMSIRTTAGAKAILEFENGNTFRLNENTEVKISKLSNEEILLEQQKGETYHRVVEGTNYSVELLDQKITALGTAFNVAYNDESGDLEIKVIKNKVKIEASQSNEKTLEEGEQLKIENKDDEEVLSVSDIPEEDLKSGWFSWNKEEDSKKSYALGILEEREDPEDETAAEESSTEKSSNNTEKTAHLTLSAAAQTDGVHLSWQPYSGSDFTFYKVVRSEDNPDLKYPEDGYIKYSGEQNLSLYIDTTAKNGKSYYYRVCVKVDSGAVLCGNVSKIKSITEDKTAKDEEEPADSADKTEEPKTEDKAAFVPVSGELQLTVSRKEGGVYLSWTPRTEDEFKYYKVVRSETNSNLYYPADGYIYYTEDQDIVSYIDKDAVSGKKYFYRICSKEASGEVWCGNVAGFSNYLK